MRQVVDTFGVPATRMMLVGAHWMGPFIGWEVTFIQLYRVTILLLLERHL
jgi:hypothetical protein